jgi:hypothetical protein
MKIEDGTWERLLTEGLEKHAPIWKGLAMKSLDDLPTIAFEDLFPEDGGYYSQAQLDAALKYLHWQTRKGLETASGYRVLYLLGVEKAREMEVKDE